MVNKIEQKERGGGCAEEEEEAKDVKVAFEELEMKKCHKNEK